MSDEQAPPGPPRGPDDGSGAGQPPDPWGRPSPYAAQPGQPPGGWYAGPAHQPPPGTSPLAITGLVTGIIGVLGSCFCWFAPVLPIAAVVTGFLGKGQVDREPQRYTGRAMAWWGVGLGVTGLVLSIVLAVFFVALGVLGDGGFDLSRFE